MEDALMIVLALLILLIAAISVRGLLKSRAGRKQEQAEAGVRAGEAEAQHDRSLARQAGVRAARAERAPTVDSDTNERDTS
jgi:hypothetical protein